MAAMFTTAYSFKVAYWTFFSRTSFNFKEIVKNWHSITLIEVIVLGILSVLSIWAGFLFKDCFIGFGTSYFYNNTMSLSPLLVEGEFLPVELKLIPLMGIVIILILTYWISQNALWSLEWSKQSLPFYSVYSFLSHKWYFNLLQNILVSKLILKWGYESFWIWDRWLLEQVRLKNY
jgi:NADH-ubiquinone oxidoreductase chain 5